MACVYCHSQAGLLPGPGGRSISSAQENSEELVMARITLPLALVLLVGLLVLPAFAAQPVDFRVESSVFLIKEKSILSTPGKPKPEELISRSTTIFNRGVIYDFLDHPAEIIIFDPANQRFILLDVDRKLRTELTTTIVGKAIDRLKGLAKSAKTDRTRFLLDPKFDESVDTETGALVFDSEWLTYRVTGTPAGNPAVVQQYRDFSDWAAKLNAFLRPNSQPPFARLILDEALAKRGEVPSKIELTLKTRHGLTTHKEQLRAEYHLVKRLVESDRRRIAQAGKQMAAFKQVGFRQYEARLNAEEKKPAEVPAKPKSQ